MTKHGVGLTQGEREELLARVNRGSGRAAEIKRANLLPAVMHMHMGKIPQDLNFMHSSLEEFQQRYREMAQRPIGDFIVIKNITYVYPDTSLMEVVNLIHKHQSRIFICERNSNKLIGLISIDHLLGQIIGAQ